uniref:HELP domain-containing protein n=2 Tax=Macrostomum lignano TaxID=282301 RepID=A0A1I8IUD6_9PLAT
YGYRGNDCRSNIHALRTQEIVYFSGHLVVILNLEENQQRHYREHTADVQCLSVHSDGLTVASGQGQGHRKPTERPCIRVWRSDTLETLSVLGDGQFHGSVVGLAFCKPSVS